MACSTVAHKGHAANSKVGHRIEKLDIGHLNIRSLSIKMDEIKILHVASTY